MTDAQVRYCFELDDSEDLDRPVARLGFRSYREVAAQESEHWVELCRREFARRYQEEHSK